MNDKLSRKAFDLCLLSLEHALIRARMACWQNDIDRAAAIVDAFHNLPRLLLGEPAGGPRSHWSVRAHNEMFLAQLLERYPDLRGTGLDHTLEVEASDDVP